MLWPRRARWLIVVFVVEDETNVLDNKAGTADEAMDRRIDGVGCSVGKTTRGLPNVGSESERGVELGCRRVGKEVETGSVMVLDTSWFLESDYQHMNPAGGMTYR